MRWIFALGVSALVGCAASPAKRAAESGDFPALKREIAVRERSGGLSNREAASLAQIVVENELRSAKLDQAAERVRETRACAPELDGVLFERMNTHDAAGAEAALSLMDAGRLDDDDVRAFVADPDDHWRALGARTLSRPDDRTSRLHAMVDPSPDVRRAALRAAGVAREPSDFDALAEAARLDPKPIVRTEAVRALAQLGRTRGAAVSSKMRDLWPDADDAIREDIANAYSMPGIYEGGGRAALVVLLASERGPGVIAGAGAILRAPATGARGEAEIRASAVALLARTIETGTHRDRSHAIAIGPLTEAPVAEAVRKAAGADSEAKIRVGALSRLTSLSSDRARAIAALEELAAQKDDPSTGSRARLALATAGDLRIQAWVEAELSSPSSAARLEAAAALAALGRSARGAALLGDPDPAVRTRAGCTLIVAARSR